MIFAVHFEPPHVGPRGEHRRVMTGPQTDARTRGHRSWDRHACGVLKHRPALLLGGNSEGAADETLAGAGRNLHPLVRIARLRALAGARVLRARAIVLASL